MASWFYKYNHPRLLVYYAVPGDGGSQLQARINKSTVPHLWCEKTSSSWFDLWLSIESMLPGAIGCWADNIR